MPKYDYRCKGCRHVFEVTRRMGDAKSTEICPDCGWEGIRLFSPPHVAQFVAADPKDPEQWR